MCVGGFYESLQKISCGISNRARQAHCANFVPSIEHSAPNPFLTVLQIRIRLMKKTDPDPALDCGEILPT